MLELPLGVGPIGIHRLKRITARLLVCGKHISVGILPVDLCHAVVDVAIIVAQVRVTAES